ncbi:hypothetical protein F441_08375 [Phytophthora nicotianae CJ01A1]|uniref:Uncharacterized protein n=5 Tax=Phytophthora nicotianae TaxID=4792 RepID=V9F9G0_PHYNI|nr:hypothetical protein F443_08393 [Phytophthora nicotianae P1569]ETK87321.1 hypothetical protein L915_08225 [Phytophthora nicotianae]ETO76056.1 hypothetical protein F444_08449 [Phytophthora nicotianae P1976]ETP17179.1 hypothetical protein F441_08375 [Phytophthora nicotianae CJ01A1]ETP45207.1 hypothetical protein F442_08331 [Phytophthora nicotianae P10297]
MPLRQDMQGNGGRTHSNSGPSCVIGQTTSTTHMRDSKLNRHFPRSLDEKLK